MASPRLLLRDRVASASVEALVLLVLPVLLVLLQEDKFEGKYKDVPFAACDVTTWHEEDDDDGGSRTVIDFDGQHAEIDNRKDQKFEEL